MLKSILHIFLALFFISVTACSEYDFESDCPIPDFYNGIPPIIPDSPVVVHLSRVGSHEKLFSRNAYVPGEIPVETFDRIPIGEKGTYKKKLGKASLRITNLVIGKSGKRSGKSHGGGDDGHCAIIKSPQRMFNITFCKPVNQVQFLLTGNTLEYEAQAYGTKDKLLYTLNYYRTDEIIKNHGLTRLTLDFINSSIVTFVDSSHSNSIKLVTIRALAYFDYGVQIDNLSVQFAKSSKSHSRKKRRAKK